MRRRYTIHRDGDLLVEELDAEGKAKDPEPVPPEDRLPVEVVVSADDTDGYVVSTQPASWTAVFGFYTPTMRKADLIPGQVRLLGSLLAKAGESKVARVILATDRDGTYEPRATPRSSASPKP